MIEFSKYTECPHCEHETYCTALFDFNEADEGGCNSMLMQEHCGSCGEPFWLKAYVSFDIDVHGVWKKKPKGVK